uniref:NADH-ubiquinone oxidoreductase chain 2 n=1 Tax=Laonastes aenigmamus TaxID=340180 RepID=A0A342KAR2_9HYST|nr:NADH dehydrogenase subunit 2 [Laonastes aenigmamus]ANC48883.1 NADH dehydrogenase subunit 2 [Laonastes aenigmamus]ANC48896.1 NADH dehydrogenase subunit 2 [Laonastes aenigmamus]
MKPLAQLIIYSTLLSGTLITLISSHWFLAWVGLEMSMLAMIPILMTKSNPRSIEAATKYFLIQATASMILMMAMVLNAINSGHWAITNPNNHHISNMLVLALLMKLGLSPFHFWVPEVTQGVTLISGMIMLTWQKLAPLAILYQIYPSIDPTMTCLLAALSTLIGGWGGLNQLQLRKMLAYSSITHMGWMISIMVYNPLATLTNLAIYIPLTILLFSTLHHSLSTTTNSLSLIWNTSPPLTITTMLALLSLGGLPPFTGFFPKWLIIQELIHNNNTILPTIMVMTALLNLFFYMRLVYSTSLTLLPTTNATMIKWQPKTPPTLMAPMTLITTLTMPLSPIMFTMH